MRSGGEGFRCGRCVTVFEQGGEGTQKEFLSDEMLLSTNLEWTETEDLGGLPVQLRGLSSYAPCASLAAGLAAVASSASVDGSTAFEVLRHKLKSFQVVGANKSYIGQER